MPGHDSGTSTLGTFVTPKWRSPSWRPDHFCLALHVAMQVGLYLQRSSRSVAWRAVSEDPANTTSRLLARCLPWAFIP